jgi:hypothetical protein
MKFARDLQDFKKTQHHNFQLTVITSMNKAKDGFVLWLEWLLEFFI